MGLTLRLFGPFQVILGNEPVPRGKRRASEHLLALLALRPTTVREQLAALLWPESRSDLANFYLRRALSELRSQLGEHKDSLIDVPIHHLSLEVPVECCDLWRFEEALEQGDDTLAVGLYTAPLLQGWDFDWVIAERNVRQQQFLAALERLAKEAQTSEKAIQQLRKIVALDPTHESAWRALMEALAQRGDPGAVVEAFRDLRLYLQDALRVAPSPETIACYERLRVEARLRAERTTARALLPEKRNLPRPLTPLFGRTSALTAIAQQLESTSLLTLVGIGGVGKTRLAIATLEEAAEQERYRDGVAWVDLAALLDPSLIRARVATALSLSESENLATQIGDRQFLLALDNCEHLLDDVAQLAEVLLTKCPQLRILATSREPLGINGESVWRVPPLAEDDAVQLFENRARHAQTNWSLTTNNRPLVARLCHRLDDLALAIELAAARISALSLEELLQRLDDRFSLLTGGSRTALPRQQTLRAAITWSWDLLTEDERSALRQLAIFASHFSLQAAEATCDKGVDALTALVTKSLVLFDPTTARYRLLETVREYMLERGIGEEGFQARQRHLAYVIDFLRQWEQHKHSPQSRPWTERVATSHDNIRIALSFALDNAPQQALMLTGLLWPFWVEYGYRQEGLQHLHLALERGKDGEPQQQIRPRLGAGALAYETGDFANASTHLELAIALAQAHDDTWAEGEGYRILGLTHWNQGRIDECKRCYEQSLRCFKSISSNSGQASTLACLGHLAWNLGEHTEAIRCNRESQNLYRALQDEAGIAETSAHLGLIARSQGNYAEARPYFEEALTIRRRLGLRAGVAALVHHLGVLAYFERELPKAKAHLEESVALWRELSDPGWVALSLYYLGLVLRMQKDWLAAIEVLLEARTLRRTQNATRSIAAIQFALGTVWLEQGRREEARDALQESSLLRYQIGLAPFCSEALDALAAVYSRNGDSVQAVRLLARATLIRQGHDEIEEEHPYRDEATKTARARLRPEQYQQAWEEGQLGGLEALL